MHSDFFNFQLVPAPVAVLAFLALGLGDVVALGSAVVLRALGRRRLAALALLGSAAATAVYLVVLVGLSALSREQVAEPGEEKYFCEVDCHLAYSVVGVQSAGSRRIVTLRVRFDENTIASCRSRDVPLTPNRRRVRVVDANGRIHAPAATTTRDLSLARPLRPGDSYLTRLVFELPASARDARLLITEANPATRLLLGHENSFLHRKTFLAVAPDIRGGGSRQ